jgi:hypothetical protein
MFDLFTDLFTFFGRKHIGQHRSKTHNNLLLVKSKYENFVFYKLLEKYLFVEAVNAGSEHWRNPPVQSSKSVNGKTASGAKYNQSQLNRLTDHWYSTLVTPSSRHGEQRPAAAAATSGRRSSSCYWTADQAP